MDLVVPSSVKRVVERMIVVGGGAAVLRRIRRRHAVVLAYHNIVPAGAPRAGESSLHLPEEVFARQLDQLAETHEVVPLHSLFEHGAPGAGERPLRAAITFDDGYRGALTAGVRALASRSMPATFFVAPGLIGQDGFWWDKLVPEGATTLPAGLRDKALEKACGRTGDVYLEGERLGISPGPVPRHAGAATLDELKIAASEPGITIGSHSWSHPNLARVGSEELDGELERPLRWLNRRFGDAVVPWLALPYGRSDSRVRSAARRVGYRGIVRNEGGMAPPGVDRFFVPRVNVPSSVSMHGFVLRASGF